MGIMVPVGYVAGVVDPHKLIKALAPPRGELQPHVEAVLRICRWVPPAEPVPLQCENTQAVC